MTARLAALAIAVLCAGQDALAQDALLVEEGRRLFFNETFNGNGRTCGTCHPATNNLTLDPAFIATLPADDPLFVAEFNPDLAGLENPALMRSQALILENLDGFDRPGVMRGIPHTLALPTSTTPDADGDADQLFPDGTRPVNPLGWSADGSPGDGSMREFAIGAVLQHFPRTLARRVGTDFRLPTDSELDALAAFQLSLGRQRDVQIAALSFTDATAQSGLRLFQGIGNNENGTPLVRSCDGCHENAGAGSANDNFDTGIRTLTPAGAPPDGGFGQDADPAGLVPGFGNGTFNTPPLIEAADSPPFFHNNSATTLEAAVTFYTTDTFGDSPSGQAGGGAFNLGPQDIADVAAFLRALNGMENARSSDNLALAAVRAPDGPTAIARLTEAEAELEQGTASLLASGLAPDAVQAFVDADGFLDQALLAGGPATRIRLAQQARTILQSIPDLIAVDTQVVAGN